MLTSLAPPFRFPFFPSPPPLPLPVPLSSVQLLLNLPFEFYTLVPISILGGIFNGIPGPNIKAMVLNKNTRDARGSAMAIFSLTNVVGKGLGPPLVGILIARFGRQTTFCISACLLWFLIGVLLLMVGRSIGADEDYVAQQVFFCLFMCAWEGGMVDPTF